MRSVARAQIILGVSLAGNAINPQFPAYVALIPWIANLEAAYMLTLNSYLSDFGRDDEVGTVFQTREEASRRRGKQKGHGFGRMQKNRKFSVTCVKVFRLQVTAIHFVDDMVYDRAHNFKGTTVLA